MKIITQDHAIKLGIPPVINEGTWTALNRGAKECPECHDTPSRPCSQHVWVITGTQLDVSYQMYAGSATVMNHDEKVVRLHDYNPGEPLDGFISEPGWTPVGALRYQITVCPTPAWCTDRLTMVHGARRHRARRVWDSVRRADLFEHFYIDFVLDLEGRYWAPGRWWKRRIDSGCRPPLVQGRQKWSSGQMIRSADYNRHRSKEGQLVFPDSTQCPFRTKGPWVPVSPSRASGISFQVSGGWDLHGVVDDDRITEWRERLLVKWGLSSSPV